jgi:hypothetical protein
MPLEIDAVRTACIDNRARELGRRESADEWKETVRLQHVASEG